MALYARTDGPGVGGCSPIESPDWPRTSGDSTAADLAASAGHCCPRLAVCVHGRHAHSGLASAQRIRKTHSILWCTPSCASIREQGSRRTVKGGARNNRDVRLLPYRRACDGSALPPFCVPRQHAAAHAASQAIVERMKSARHFAATTSGIGVSAGKGSAARSSDQDSRQPTFIVGREIAVVSDSK